jgi:hypothetical protein
MGDWEIASRDQRRPAERSQEQFAVVWARAAVPLME